MARTLRPKKQGRRATLLSIVGVLLLVPLTLWIGLMVSQGSYYVSATLIALYALVPFIVSFEGRRPQARELAILAVMAALAVMARLVFIAVPHFKPMGAIIMIAGLAFGPQSGFLVGVVAMAASNFIFGQGPWTPWQMLAFGVGGLGAGLLGKTSLLPTSSLSRWQRVGLALFGFGLTVAIVGPILDTSSVFLMLSKLTPASVLAIYGAGLPINITQGIAVALTLYLVANPLLNQLDRLKTKYGILA